MLSGWFFGRWGRPSFGKIFPVWPKTKELPSASSLELLPSSGGGLAVAKPLNWSLAWQKKLTIFDAGYLFLSRSKRFKLLSFDKDLAAYSENE